MWIENDAGQQGRNFGLKSRGSKLEALKAPRNTESIKRGVEWSNYVIISEGP